MRNSYFYKFFAISKSKMAAVALYSFSAPAPSIFLQFDGKEDENKVVVVFSLQLIAMRGGSRSELQDHRVARNWESKGMPP